MKIVEYHDILNKNLFTSSDALATAWQEISAAIQATDWPHGSG